ncbi:hypothetical protein J7K27_08855 [Candidatus Bathyarchaeota archaeon]|nr:hypothetical protein [Candidatus Bathyarchaeota archaeon]
MEKGKEKFCGNCVHHNVYEYPSKIFCTYRLVKGLDPVVPTLWCCEHWTPETQGCFCIEDAKKEKQKKEASS